MRASSAERQRHGTSAKCQTRTLAGFGDVKPSLRFGPQVDDPPGLACGALDFARLGDHDLDTQSNRTAYVRREQPAQRAACKFRGMARPCFGQDTHGIETFVAPQLDDEMRGKPFAA